MKKVQTVGMTLTLAAVLVLGGSLLWGLREGGAEVVPVPGAAGLPEAPEGRGRVEVLNAGGVPGAAREATRLLRDRGFDVVYFGNARGFSPDTSRVLDRAGRGEPAEAVAEALEIGRVDSRPDTTLLLEVTVVLGRDWTLTPP